MKRNLLVLAALAFVLLPCRAHAQSVASSFDPCLQFPKQSVAINVSTAADAQLVAAVANAPVYVCGMALNQVDGTGSVKLEYGTGTNCGTGQTELTGPIFASTVANGTTNTQLGGSSNGGTQVLVPAGNALCVKSTGTIQQSGWLTYVQSTSVNAASYFDPCNQYPKQSATMNFSSATTKTLVPNGGAAVTTYICSILWEDAGRATTANTTTFEYGTKVTNPCDTGTTSLTGPLTGSLTAGAATFLGASWEPLGTQIVVPAGDDFCAVTGQSSTVTGVVTYVQH